MKTRLFAVQTLHTLNKFITVFIAGSAVISLLCICYIPILYFYWSPPHKKNRKHCSKSHLIFRSTRTIYRTQYNIPRILFRIRTSISTAQSLARTHIFFFFFSSVTVISIYIERHSLLILLHYLWLVLYNVSLTKSSFELVFTVCSSQINLFVVVSIERRNKNVASKKKRRRKTVAFLCRTFFHT